VVDASQKSERAMHRDYGASPFYFDYNMAKCGGNVKLLISFG
jgi:hypothetical protein